MGCAVHFTDAKKIIPIQRLGDGSREMNSLSRRAVLQWKEGCCARKAKHPLAVSKIKTDKIGGVFIDCEFAAREPMRPSRVGQSEKRQIVFGFDKCR